MLCLNSLPAERARGCRFAEKFESPTAVAKNRGTVVGAVPILPGKGADFPGTVGNHITYPCGSILNKSALSVVIDFIPNFAADDGNNKFWFDSTGTERSLLFKSNTNAISLHLGNATLVLSSSIATYGPYWNDFQRNTLVCCGLSTGANYMYLNGQLIDSSATAWTPHDPTTIYVGCRFSGIYVFDGHITNFKIFTGNVAADLLTAQEAKDYYLRGA